MELTSDLWLDQPNAHDRIEIRHRSGDLDDARAALLHTFVDEGFARIELDLDDAFFDRFEEDVASAWRDRPEKLAVSPLGPDRPVSFSSYDGPERAPGYRIPDFHGYSDAALDLYLDPVIFEMIELLFGHPALAFQSLYFEYGSRQPLHRDPMFVPTSPASHLLASWTALEDIVPEAGPLEYVPGSHREPWFEFEPGSIVRRPTVSMERVLSWRKSVTDLTDRTPALSFRARRGETFIWHGGLFHGGAPVNDPTLTRKSFVVHYSTAHTYRSRTAGMRIRDGDEWTTVQCSANAIIERGSSRGLMSPLAQFAQPGNDYPSDQRLAESRPIGLSRSMRNVAFNAMRRKSYTKRSR
ncbi:MAG: phytanoyl-CoA dioxygenase family protein [Actinomycetota bacterium]